MWFPFVLALTVQTVNVPTQQSRGALGIEAARRGGVVIACRHAITESADEDELTLRYDDPATQRRLSAEGERQAGELGKAFRVLRIKVAEVIVSPMQRARRSGELALGKVVVDSLWHTRGEDYGGPRQRLRSEVLGRPVDGGARVIFSHIGTLYSVLPSITGQLDEGDCVVVRPRGDTRYEIIEVVPWRSWVTAARMH
jgi:phosphohistidine phosphatase SixA